MALVEYLCLSFFFQWKSIFSNTLTLVSVVVFLVCYFIISISFSTTTSFCSASLNYLLRAINLFFHKFTSSQIDYVFVVTTILLLNSLIYASKSLNNKIRFLPYLIIFFLTFCFFLIVLIFPFLYLSISISQQFVIIIYLLFSSLICFTILRTCVVEIN